MSEVSEVARLSPSVAQKLNDEGALSAWANHRLMGNLRKRPTDGQIKGTINHASLLGDSEAIEVVTGFDNFKTKAAKEVRDDIFDRGKTPVIESKWEESLKTAEHLRELILSRHGIDLDGAVKETRLEWTEFSRSGKAVECSGFMDLWDQNLKVTDLKTGDGYPTPEKIATDLARSHGLLQDRAYRGGVAQLMNVAIEEVDMVYLGVQMVPPYATCPARMKASFRECSEIRWQQAIDDWASFSESGEWSVRYGMEPAEMDAPGWLLNKALADEAMLDE